MNEILAKIARDHLRIATLETRGSDRLDFHEVHVQAIRDALQAAFEAGRADATGEPPPPVQDGRR